MSDQDSPEEIEREIEQTRANLDRTLSDLQHKLAPSALVDKALASNSFKSALRSAGSGTADVAASLGRLMSNNPVPVLLTVVGVAWLAFSSRSSSAARDEPELVPYEPDRPQAPVPVPPTSVAGESVGPSFGREEPPSFGREETRSSSREDPSRGPRYEHVQDPTLGGSQGDVFGVSQTLNTAGYGGSRAAGSSSNSTSNPPLDTRTDAEVTEKLKAEASRRRGRRIGERARGAATSVSTRMERVSETLSQGVERMTGVVKGGGAYEPTRNVASRATHAVRQVPTRVGDVYHSAGGFIQENPIIAGAVAIALGAALALMLPPTRRERRLIGEASDEVKASVREGLEETVDRAKDVVRSATEAAADAARKEVTKGRETANEDVAPAPELVTDVPRPAASPDIDMATGARPTPGE